MAGFFKDFTKIPTVIYTSQPEEEDFIPLLPDQISRSSPDQMSMPLHRYPQPRMKMSDASPFLGCETAEINNLNSQNIQMSKLEVEARVKQQQEAPHSSIQGSVARKLEEKRCRNLANLEAFLGHGKLEYSATTQRAYDDENDVLRPFIR